MREHAFVLDAMEQFGGLFHDGEVGAEVDVEDAVEAEAMERRDKARLTPAAKQDRPPAKVEIDIDTVQEVMTEYYTRWMDKPLPALGNRTPRHAATLKTQKAKVAELLKSMENNESRVAKSRGEQPMDFGFLWKELGLER